MEEGSGGLVYTWILITWWWTGKDDEEESSNWGWSQSKDWNKGTKEPIGWREGDGWLIYHEVRRQDKERFHWYNSCWVNDRWIHDCACMYKSGWAAVKGYLTTVVVKCYSTHQDWFVTWIRAWVRPTGELTAGAMRRRPHTADLEWCTRQPAWLVWFDPRLNIATSPRSINGRSNLSSKRQRS